MERFAYAVVRYRKIVLTSTLLLTAFFAAQLRNLDVIVDSDELLPRSHPFVQVTERVEQIFGNRFTVLVGVTPKSGDVFQPDVLDKVLRITEGLAATPGVTPGNLQSLAAPRAKDIEGNADGLVVTRLLDHRPADRAEARRVLERLRANPVYDYLLVSSDGRTAAIYAEFKKNPRGFGEVMRGVHAVIDPMRDGSVSIAVAGQPVFLAALETFSKRMAFLLPIALLVIGMIHFEAFRTVQGLVLPLVTAILSVIWALGVMTLSGVHLDPFNNITPILILAVAAGHAVQVLKRYYEEYAFLRRTGMGDARAASREAVVRSINTVGPVMVAAGTIAGLSFMSLAAFPIESIRSFGVFAGLGIFSVVLVELSFTPALRAMLTPPGDREVRAERHDTFWDRLARRCAAQVATPAGRRRVVTAWIGMVIAMGAGAAMVRVDNSLRGFIGEDRIERRDDRFLNAAMAGSNSFYVLVEGAGNDAVKNPAVLRGMERVQAFLDREPQVGRSISLVDMLKRINQAMNGGGAAQNRLPESRELVSQYLLLYSMSGEPGDFDGLVDYDYRRALIQTFVKTDSSAYVESLHRRIAPVIRDAGFPPDVRVRLGGAVTTPTAMNEVIVHGKLWNIGQLALVVFAVASLLFRSPSLGGLVLVPLAATTLAIFGVMGWSGIPLQIATATLGAMAIGIGADYAIYLSYRLREELRARPDDEAEAVTVTFQTAGKAVMFCATAIAGGYCVLMLSIGFNIHFWLGLLVSLAMVVGATSTLTLYAALLLMVRPRAIFETPRAAVAEPARAREPVAVAASLGAVALLLAPAPARAQEAAELMARSVTVTKALKSRAASRFTLINKAGQRRVRDTESVSQLKPDGRSNRRLIRFNAPADIAGTSVLTIENAGADDDIWVYLPALKKVRRLAASNKKDAFVGTDFTYGDILGHPAEEWNHRLLRDETVGGTAFRVIESTPKTPAVAADTGYGRRVSWLRAADAVPFKVEFYDRRNGLLKTYTAGDVRLVDPANRRFQPMKQRMANAQTGHSTLIEYGSFDTSAALPADQFTPARLDRR